MVTYGCAGLAAALQTVYPWCCINVAGCIRCNILEKARMRDYAEMKTVPRPSIRPKTGCRRRLLFAVSVLVGMPSIPRWSGSSTKTCRGCCPFSAFPGTSGANYAPPTSLSVALWKFGVALGLRCVFNEASVEGIIYSILQRFSQEWKNRTLSLFTHAALMSPTSRMV